MCKWKKAATTTPSMQFMNEWDEAIKIMLELKTFEVLHYAHNSIINGNGQLIKHLKMELLIVEKCSIHFALTLLIHCTQGLREWLVFRAVTLCPLYLCQIGTNHFDSRDSILYLLNRFIANFHSFGEKSAIEREEAAYRMLAARTCEWH